MDSNSKRSTWILRTDGVFLILAGGVAMIGDLVGHFRGAGPFAASLGSPYSIAAFEAHGFAALIGVLLFLAASKADRKQWHFIGLITHLFLGSANLLFWSSFAQQNLVAAGYVTTSLHLALVFAQASCLRAR